MPVRWSGCFQSSPVKHETHQKRLIMDTVESSLQLQMAPLFKTRGGCKAVPWPWIDTQFSSFFFYKINIYFTNFGLIKTTPTTPPRYHLRIFWPPWEPPHPTPKKFRVVSKPPHPTPKNLGWFSNHPTPPQKTWGGSQTTPPHPKKI